VTVVLLFLFKLSVILADAFLFSRGGFLFALLEQDVLPQHFIRRWRLAALALIDCDLDMSV